MASKTESPEPAETGDGPGRHRTAELDAVDANDLRLCVERAMVALIEPETWHRCLTVNAERESLSHVLS
jgi:hypothetical protein